MVKKKASTKDMALTASMLRGIRWSNYTYESIIKRAEQYYHAGKVIDIKIVNHSKADCHVKGSGGTIYDVELGIDSSTGNITYNCTCPYNGICKHTIAAAMAIADRLDNIPTEPNPSDEEKQLREMSLKWKTQAEHALYIAKDSNGKNRQKSKASLVVLLSQTNYSANRYVISVNCYLVRERKWEAYKSVNINDSNQVQQLLDRDFGWLGCVSDVPKNPDNIEPLNVSESTLAYVCALRNSYESWDFPYSLKRNLIKLMQFGIPAYQVEDCSLSKMCRLKLLEEKVGYSLKLKKSDAKITIISQMNNPLFSKGDQAKIVNDDPFIGIYDDWVFQTLDDTSFTTILSDFPLEIPSRDINEFREKYYPDLVKNFPLSGEGIKQYLIEEKPVPHLYLTDSQEDSLKAELRFAYHDIEREPDKNAPSEETQTQPNSWDVITLRRDIEAEENYRKELGTAKYGLKKISSASGQFYTLRANISPYEFLVESVPNMQDQGVEVYGEEKLKNIRVNYSTPKIRVNISSKIDWFDLQMDVSYGDMKVDFQDIRKAIRKGRKFIKLPDRSVGMIPDEWLEKYKYLFGMAEESADGLRVSSQRAALLDPIMGDLSSSREAKEINRRRELLKNFDGIKEQKLPQGLNGELRPYQKHGFDWLYFLYENHYGGILADDMGLGKTLQMLTFLLSLKERASAAKETNPVSLLIVPKSLIENWQLESSKFTPDLDFFPFIGNFREKDLNEFSKHDVVLTTYGTMLHDVELLKDFQFTMIILDESQAIKNPLAKSSRAAYALQGRHRMVMTGTPVENNTIELWSQFNFVSPGFLGNIEYFKSMFAVPIESHQDQTAAETLKKLVNPFILRRTKLQVAPELPAKTERINYVEMSPEQKAVYQKVRDKYRTELSGIIENGGMDNDSRFKILEGLLRLRQIAIDPKLYDPDYSGEVPKFGAIIDMMDTLIAEGHKALFFSQFVEVLTLLRHELDLREIPYEYLDGSTTHRQQHVNHFQDDTGIPFFLISLKAGGTGLNLTAADYVFHLDPWWNPAVEEQASDRAHRIGQEKPVFVYKLITHDSVEEKILQLQEKKKGLVNSLISTDQSIFKSLTAADISDLFA